MFSPIISMKLIYFYDIIALIKINFREEILCF